MKRSVHTCSGDKSALRAASPAGCCESDCCCLRQRQTTEPARFRMSGEIVVSEAFCHAVKSMGFICQHYIVRLVMVKKYTGLNAESKTTINYK